MSRKKKIKAERKKKENAYQVIDVDVTWYVGNSLVEIRTDSLAAHVRVSSRKWPDPDFKPFERLSGEPAYIDRKITGNEEDFILLARHCANSEGESAPILADWIYENTKEIDLTTGSWERLVETIRRCSPENTQHATLAKRLGFEPPVAVDPVVL